MEKKTRPHRTTQLTTNTLKRSIRKSPMRDMILAKLKVLGMTRYELAKAVSPHVSEQAVYGFLAKRRDMTSGLVWHLLVAVRLELTDAPEGAQPE